MSGILGIFYEDQQEGLRQRAYAHSSLQRHRGPDRTGIVVIEERIALCHETLIKKNTSCVKQPFVRNELYLTISGQIHGLEELEELIHRSDPEYSVENELDAVLTLYEHHGADCVRLLRGAFAFVLYDAKNKTLLVARDPLGCVPLYQDKSDGVWFANEMKALPGSPFVFQPGTFLYGELGSLRRKCFFKPSWLAPQNGPHDKIMKEMTASIESLTKDCNDFGVLLTGSIDSNVVAVLCNEVMSKKNTNFKLRTYAVGLENSSELDYVQQAAKALNSTHTEILFSVEDALDVLPDVVRYVESYDVATIRLCIPMFIAARRIRADGIKVVLCDEGADDLFAGYLYFRNAPSTDELHSEIVQRVLSTTFPSLKTDRALSAWGVELRSPFLDLDFVDYAMCINPELKSTDTAKELLHAAFNELLPSQVLKKEKRRKTDEVESEWMDALKSYAEDNVTDEELAMAHAYFKVNTPTTKEAYYYRKVFNAIYPGEVSALTVTTWKPRTDWDAKREAQVLEKEPSLQEQTG